MTLSKFNHQVITRVVDTGADVTIISTKDWNKDWATQTSFTEVSGLGSSTPLPNEVNTLY